MNDKEMIQKLQSELQKASDKYRDAAHALVVCKGNFSDYRNLADALMTFIQDREFARPQGDKNE